MSKIKLIESFSIDFTTSKLKENVEILPKPKLVEDSKHKQFEARAIIRDIPVSRYTENHNGRVYNQSLWESVLRSKRAEGSDCYGNHSESDDGNVFDTVGVWHNLRIGENFPIADLYCIGEGGSLLAEKAKAGGKVGFSSVGYGEFLEDKKTVNPDTYELEHLADWVVSPSQEVYATYENIKENEKISEKNNTEIQKDEKSNQLLKEDITNKLTEKVDNSNIEKQQVKEVKFMEKFEEANLKNHVNAEISKALKNQDIKEAIEILKEIDTAGVDYLTEKVNKTINILQDKLDEQKKNAEKAFVEKTSELEALQKKYDENTKSMESLQKNYDRLSKTLETLIKEQDVEDKSVTVLDDADANNLGKGGYTDIEDKNYTFKDLKNNPKGMDINSTPPNQVVQGKGESGDKIGNEASSIIENTRKMKEDKKRLAEEISQLKEDRENMKADIKALLEDRKVMIGDIKQLIKDRKTMREDIKTLIAKFKELKKKVKEGDAAVEVKPEDEKKEENIVTEDLNDVNDGNEPYEFSFEPEKQEEVAPMENEPMEGSTVPEEHVAEAEDEFVVPEDNMSPEAEKQVQEAETETQGKPDEIFNDIVAPEGTETLEPKTEADDEEEFDFNDEDLNMEEADDVVDQVDADKPTETKQAESKEVKKPVMKENTVKNQISEYFDAEVKFNSTIKDIKDKVLDSKSLGEAVTKINKFKESLKNKKNDSPIKFSESTNKRPSWLQEGRL